MVYDGVIQGKTVRLRSITEADAEVTFNMRSDPGKSRFFHAAKGTVEDQLRYIKQQRQTPGDYLFVFEDINGKPIGMKGLYNYNLEKKEIESGRFIGFGSQIQNIEALMLCFDFAFDTLGVERINMAALENNTAMLGIQERFGVVFTYKEKIEGFEYKNYHSYLIKAAYDKNRIGIIKLIERFANRVS